MKLYKHEAERILPLFNQELFQHNSNAHTLRGNTYEIVNNKLEIEEHSDNPNFYEVIVYLRDLNDHSSNLRLSLPEFLNEIR